MLLQLLAVVSLAALAGRGDGAETSTHIRVYMHAIAAPTPESNVTEGRITNGTTPLPGTPAIRFGDMYVIDDLLTEGPNATSPAVGRAEGFYLFSSRTQLTLITSFSVVFTAGPHNGSSVTVLGRDLIVDKVREVPVVGGTGPFRGATGYGELRTLEFNATNFNSVLQVDLHLSL